MVSLKTIAEKCGVSTATVSKALNDQKDVSEETKHRIKKTAEALGYFPNAAARALKTNRSYNIGVLFEEEAGSGLTHEYFSGVLNGLKVQAEKQGYDITFINTCFENRKMSYYEHCRYRNFEGVAIVCADYNDPDVLELMNSDLPVVTIDYVHHNCTAVSSNNIQGIEDLVKYIYQQGHRKIAYIHGQENSYVTKDRLASFYRTMDELGLEVPDKGSAAPEIRPESAISAVFQENRLLGYADAIDNIRIAGGNIPVEGKFLLHGDMKIFVLLLLGEEILEFLFDVHGKGALLFMKIDFMDAGIKREFALTDATDCSIAICF